MVIGITRLKKRTSADIEAEMLRLWFIISLILYNKVVIWDGERLDNTTLVEYLMRFSYSMERITYSSTSRSKSLAVFGRRNERFDHFTIDEVAVELIQLRQPEFVAGVVSVGTAVRIAPQITEELHQHERAVEFIRY